MSYRIPDEATLAMAIEMALAKKPHAGTQGEFADAVRAELDAIGGYRAGDVRIRRVAIERGLAGVAIEYRESSRQASQSACPVCGNAMKSSMNGTLDGDRVEIRRKCTVCPYSAAGKATVPGRYSFFPSEGPAVPDNVRAMRTLERARAGLEEAARAVRAATRGTVAEADGENAAEEIRRLASKDGPIQGLVDSIGSLEEGDPGWARPLASVKNAYLKDI